MVPARDDVVLGMDLGGTKILTVLTDATGRILERELMDTPVMEGPWAVIEGMAAAARRVLQRRGRSRDEVLGLGIGAPGPADPEAGVVLSAPNLPGWRDIPLRDALSQELGVPAILENDANAAALGEHRLGAGRGARHMLYVTVSTGIGAGLILDGRLYGGASGTAGEVGHIPLLAEGPLCSCGNHGCLEVLASGAAIAMAARSALGSGEPSSLRSAAGDDLAAVGAVAVFQAAAQGDTLAAGIIERAAFYFGLGLMGVVNLLNPEIIVLGGGVSQQWDAYVEPAVRVMRARAFARPAERVWVVPAALGGDAGALGAVVMALDAFGGGVAGL